VPGLSVTGVRLVIPDLHLGASRVACAFLVYMPSPLPRHSDWGYSSLILPNRVSLPRYGSRVGLRIDLSEACSAFTRVTACTLARSPSRPRTITLDGYAASHRAVRELKADGWLPANTKLRSSKYLNNLIEQDHRGVKQRIAVMLGFKEF